LERGTGLGGDLRCLRALGGGKTLLLCGNGGSASDAMHITGELVGRFLMERKALRAICLTSNPSVLTAWANECGYESIFSRQVEAYGEAGGVLPGLSTSGNSKNVIKAFGQARLMGMTTIALTGEGGGETHVCLYHYLCQEIEKRLASRA
jgi:D-sedoheptulose 7-phosphate isomerase